MPTMSLNYKQFPSGTVLLNIGSIPVTSNSKVSLFAPNPFDKNATAYDFLFWDADASVDSNPALTFTTPSDDSIFEVDAWYLETGGSGGGTGVTTYAFSLNQQKVVTNTPIASVTPGGAWAGGASTTVSTTTSSSPVVITALNLISGLGLFNSWLQFGDGSVTKNVLTVPAEGASQAIAFFGIPVPDPCQDLRDQLANLDPSDFPNPAAFKAAVHALSAQLRACEQKWGETLTPLL